MRRGLDLVAEALGDLDGLHFTSGRVFADAGGGDAAFGGEFAIAFPEADEVADDLAADFLNEQFAFKLLFEAQRSHVITGGMHTRPADTFLALDRRIDDGETEAAEEGVLHALHIAEEVREKDNARHVGVGELDAFDAGEAVHGGWVGS